MKIAEKPMARNDESRADDKGKKWTCICAHPTHFLGSCEVTVSRVGTTCPECMKTHFVLNDDPAVSKQ